MNKLISSKHLEGVSDLTLSAPIKQGFIDAFETVTYESRLRTIMKALFQIRSTAREHSEIKPFVDTAERIQALLDFRLAIHGNELLLSATFDRPFEPYIRLIWDPLGPLLDVIFCNCEGYVTATEHSFEDYLAWVRKSQIDTNFFYAASGHSVMDIQYVTKLERLQREAQRHSAPSVIAPDPIDLAEDVRRHAKAKSDQLGMEALVALYKLADFYPPDRSDGDDKYLLWSTQQLLDGWGRKDLDEQGWTYLVQDQLAWLERDGPPQKRACGERLTFKAEDIQGGILKSYGGKDRPVRHGALLLMRIADRVKARAFLKRLTDPLPKEPDPKDWVRIDAETAEERKPEATTFLNLAFTRHGLVNIGLPPAEIDRFPREFLEGMEERAGLLGDVRENHPRRWKLPPRERPPGVSPEVTATPVETAEVDIVFTLRTTEERDGSEPLGAGGGTIDRMVQHVGRNPDSGLELLAVEIMRRAPQTDDHGREHFGFVDGISQPKPADKAPLRIEDEVARGEIFWGYSNSRTDSPPPPSPILDNGTFLVLRKLSQEVGRLEEFVRTAVRRLQEEGAAIDAEDLYAKMMGRTRDGKALVAPGEKVPFNKFSYEGDPKGEACPFQAHIRRANPRVDKSETNGRPTPRILRRGLSYGPSHAEDPDAPRGVFFMAYNASIAEQFEVIQRWITGGNPTGVASWQSDPLMGVAQEGDPRTFSFVHNGKTLRVDIPDPFVKLQWGAYLFVPSIGAIRTIATLLPDEQAVRQAAELEQARRGETIVARLQALAADGPAGRIAAAAGWKTCLEDFSAKDPAEKDEATAVWAAIRLYHGGALQVPYGIVSPGEVPQDAVLVASKELVMRVFRDPYDNYSMCGQMARMKQSFGEIYLGMDKGPDYEAKSRINEAIFAITDRDAFDLARQATLQGLALACRVADDVGVPECKIDLRRHFITPALATICRHWFGIPDAPAAGSPDGKNFVDPFGWSWEPAETRKPRCPGDYMSTSRFCFYPDPIPRVKAYGKSQGQALRKAVGAYVSQVRRSGGIFEGKLTQIMAGLRSNGAPVYESDDELARTVIGVMTGFLPPADGCMRFALYDWIEEKTLPRVQHDIASYKSDDPFERADKGLRPWLERAMQKRPAPDLLWRTATRNHRLGNVDVLADDRVFIGIVSALAEDAAAGITDVYPVFGGDRGEAAPPMHACPAYKAAMGTMLGILSVLLENFRIEPLPAPLLVKVTDRSPLMKQLVASPQIAQAAAALTAAGAGTLPQPRPRRAVASRPAPSAHPGVPAPTGGLAGAALLVGTPKDPDEDAEPSAEPAMEVSDLTDAPAPEPAK